MQETTTHHRFTNHLIHESSPYLLQHAHNPVNWYPWNEEALQKARREDKPILVSIGYAACHWCHVMEKESFEDTAVARIMNENFVCIKIDREERPDIDQLYMEAVQAMTGSGGWPLNVFLTPDQKPFYGGTYFPPRSMYNRPSWTQVLTDISKVFRQKRQDVEKQAEQLMAYLEKSDTAFVSGQTFKVSETLKAFEEKQVENIFSNIMERADRHEGGFGAAPKFLSTMTLQFLLRYHYFNTPLHPSPENIGTGQEGREALEHAELSLLKMLTGGIYDQLGGGIARYSTDSKWLAPHFEKMLYDNALFVTVLCEAFQLTQKEIYKEAIEGTLGFVSREMTSGEGGFYSSYDADSEGEEGKYYVWEKQEIDSLLKEKSPLFCEYYDVSERGNWEGKNILNLRKANLYESTKEEKNKKDVKQQLGECRKILFEAREKRIKPALDDKIILGWNALMCSAFARAYQAVQQQEYKIMAEKNALFMLEKFRVGKNEFEFYHTYKNGKTNYPAFLDDYALLVEALLNVYEINFDENLLAEAEGITKYVLDKFYDERDKMFFYTSVEQKDIIVRKKDFYDGVIPSGISTIAENFQRLAIITGQNQYAEKAVFMLQNISPSVEKYPVSFSRWANVLLNFIHPIREIAVIGKDHQQVSKGITSLFIPNKVLMASDGVKSSGYPLLKDKPAKGDTWIYVCQNYACRKPVRTVEEMKDLLVK